MVTLTARGWSAPGGMVVVTTGGFGEPPYKPDTVNGGKTQLVQIGTKGMYVGVIGLFDDPLQPPLPQQVADDGKQRDGGERQRQHCDKGVSDRQGGSIGPGVARVPANVDLICRAARYTSRIIS